MLGGLLEYALSGTLPKETEDAPFDETLLDTRGAYIKTGETTNAADEPSLHVIGEAKEDVVDAAEKIQTTKTSSEKIEKKSTTTSLGGVRFTKKSGQKSKKNTTHGTTPTPSTKSTPQASFFRRKSKKTAIQKEGKEIDKSDIEKTTEAEKGQQGNSTTIVSPVAANSQKHDATKSESTFPTESSARPTRKEANAKDNSATDDTATKQQHKNDDMTTTDDETDTSTTSDEGGTSRDSKEPPSPLGGCTALSKEDVAHKIDEALLYLDKTVAPKLALALLCLASEEESVELGYQENTSRHRSRQSRRKSRSERNIE